MTEDNEPCAFFFLGPLKLYLNEETTLCLGLCLENRWPRFDRHELVPFFMSAEDRARCEPGRSYLLTITPEKQALAFPDTELEEHFDRLAAPQAIADLCPPEIAASAALFLDAALMRLQRKGYTNEASFDKTILKKLHDAALPPFAAEGEVALFLEPEIPANLFCPSAAGPSATPPQRGKPFPKPQRPPKKLGTPRLRVKTIRHK